MEQQKLPNVTIAIILAILSYLCCCFGGVPGLILAGIAFFLIRKDETRYRENPDGYSNYGPLKTAKILAIIGIILGLVYLVMLYFQVQKFGGWEAYMEQVRDVMEQWGFEE